MAGLFRDSSDANRRSRGPRPFAGQAHEPGSGPIKGSPVRRQTVAPFESPFAERKPQGPPPAQAAQPIPEPEVRGGLPTETELPPVAQDVLLELHRDSIPEPVAEATDATEVQLSAAHESLPRGESVLRTAELLDPPLVADESDLNTVSGARDFEESEAVEDWSFDAVDRMRDDDFSEAPFDNIESLVAPSHPRQEEPAANEPPPVQLPLSADWAISHDGEAELHAYVAAASTREQASEALEAVARRVRSGEIVVALEPDATTEAVLASVLASLLTYPT